jgi:hypothetical protein
VYLGAGALTMSVTIDSSGIAPLQGPAFKAALRRALRKAGSTALRDMRSEANKRIKTRKRIKPSYIARALTLRRAKESNLNGAEWGIDVSGEPVPLVAYPHRQTKKGVSVEVNRGKRTLVKGAFVATMRSGHKGVFKRRGKERLPIRELLGSRPLDALLHKGEADGVAARGGKSFTDTFARVLPLEIGKG